ncbi:MAG: type II restriction endonuclease [Acidimicrobiales bacterium]
MNPDVRLLVRRKCEYEIFLSVEQAVYLPRIHEGFGRIDDFIGLAQTILQSRKSRSGNSLEFQAREIMAEEGLLSGTDFIYRPVIEGGKRPDFLFPSKSAYEDAAFPANRLRMLAAKTTCKDRWRQVINEADRIPRKHLLTLQEGVSEGQFQEMQEAGVQLVVPSGLHDSYPIAVRPHLLTLESFIGDVRLLNLPVS